MPSALAYVRLDETGGTFYIFPEKSLICSRTNAPISLVCLSFVASINKTKFHFFLSGILICEKNISLTLTIPSLRENGVIRENFPLQNIFLANAKRNIHRFYKFHFLWACGAYARPSYANDKLVIVRLIRAIWEIFFEFILFPYCTRLRLVQYYGNKKNSKNISHIALCIVR